MSDTFFNPESVDPGQPYSQVDAVAELLEVSAPHQRALLGVLAVSNRYSIDPVPLLTGIAKELTSADRVRVEGLAEQISAGVEAVDALDQIPNLIPPTCLLSLQLAKKNGELTELYAALLDRYPGNDPVASSPDDIYVPKLVAMAGYVIWVTSIISFILLKIVPEFLKMLEEFEIEPPPVFIYFLRICDTTVNPWFVPLLIILCLLPFCLPRYLRRWRPLKWRQSISSPAVNRRRSLALVTQSASSAKSGISTILESASLQRTFPRLFKANARIQNGQGEWESLSAEGVITKREAKALALTTSGDTQAWLFRWLAADLQWRQSNRSSFWFRLLMITIYIALASIVVLTVLAIFMTYLHIVSEV